MTIDETDKSKIQPRELDKGWAVEDLAACLCSTEYKEGKIAAFHRLPVIKIEALYSFLKSINPLFMITR